MTIDATTGLIEWTPTADGDFNVTVEATNAAGSDAQSFVITVTPALVAPYFTSTPITEGVVGEVYTYDADAEGYPTPTYELTTAPSGMAIDEVTGVITWTPTAAGDFDVTVRATNGVSPAATQNFTISVVPGAEAPVITSTPGTNALVGQEYTYDVNASGYPAPQYELTIFPAGMTINAISGVITWTPTAAGDYDVTVRAFNASGEDFQSWVISVPDEPYTDCWPQPTILKALENDRILDIRIYNENPDNVDLGTIRVQDKIPPFTGVRIEDGVIITDVFIMRFLGSSGFRPITGDFTSTYTVSYTRLDGTDVELIGDYALQVYPGDVNLDAEVNVEDLQFLTDYIFNHGDECEYRELMDLNQDTKVDGKDLSELRSILGM
jgi:hypothetical protein